MAAPSLVAALAPEALTAAFHMSPEELAEKARQQARDSEGQFVEEADVKAELPEGMEPVGSTPEEATPAPTVETVPAVRSLTGQEAVEALTSAGYDPRQAEQVANGRVFTSDGQTFSAVSTPRSRAENVVARERANRDYLRDRVGTADPAVKDFFAARADEAQARFEQATRAVEGTSDEVDPDDEATARDALGFLQTAVAKLPPALTEGRPFLVSTDWTSKPGMQAGDTAGIATLGGDTMWVNPRLFHYPAVADEGDGWHLPTSFETSGEYTVNHELGHLIDRVSERRRDTAWSGMRDGLSAYGQENAVEGYAEAFASWMGGDRSPAVTGYARRFKWAGAMEEATPAPPVETVPAEELLPDDVIAHEGETYAVTDVVSGDGASSIRGRRIAATETGEVARVPSDQPMDVLGTVDTYVAPEAPKVLRGIPSLADLGFEKAKERRLRSLMKGSSITLNEAKREELKALRVEAYQRIGEHLGWSQEEIDAAIETEDRMIGVWTMSGPGTHALADQYDRMFKASVALRTGKMPETTDERALTLMRTYAQMTLKERGEETVPLLRMIYGAQAAYTTSAPAGTPVDVESYPLSSWATEKGLPSIRSWLGTFQAPAILRTEVPASQVWMTYYGDERFRTPDVKAKAEFIIDDGGGFNTESGVTVEAIESHKAPNTISFAAPDSWARGLAGKLWRRFSDLKPGEHKLATYTRMGRPYGAPYVLPESSKALGGVDEELLSLHAQLGTWFSSFDSAPEAIVWAARDAGIDMQRMRRFIDEAGFYSQEATRLRGMEEYRARSANESAALARELLAEDPEMVARLLDSMSKVRFATALDGEQLVLFPGQEAHQYGTNYAEVVDTDGTPILSVGSYGQVLQPDGRVAEDERRDNPRRVLPTRAWTDFMHGNNINWSQEQGGSPLDQLVHAPERNWQVDALVSDLKDIPMHWVQGLIDAGGRVEAFTGPVTAHPDQADKKGVTPRGWTNGKTWDDVPGLQEGGIVYLGTEGAHSSQSLALHETGHAFDRALGRQTEHAWLSNDPRFVEAYEALMAAHGDRIDLYYRQSGSAGRQETFGEAFVALVGPQRSRWGYGLPQKTPEFQRMLSVMTELIDEAIAEQERAKREGAETATPAPLGPPPLGLGDLRPAPQTVRARDVYEGDVVEVDGAVRTVEGVSDWGSTIMLEGDGWEAEVPADQPLQMFGQDGDYIPAPRLEDLGLSRMDQMQLRGFMQDDTLLLDEMGEMDLFRLREQAYRAIGDYYGWTPQQTRAAMMAESEMMDTWVMSGPETTMNQPVYDRAFAAAEALRADSQPQNDDQRAMLMLRVYAQMALAERGMDSVPLYRMVSGEQGAALRDGAGSPVEAQAHPLSSWATEDGLFSIQAWLGSNPDAALLQMDVPADQVWMSFYGDERFRTENVVALGEHILEPGAGFTTENGLQVLEPDGSPMEVATPAPPPMLSNWVRARDLKVGDTINFEGRPAVLTEVGRWGDTVTLVGDEFEFDIWAGSEIALWEPEPTAPAPTPRPAATPGALTGQAAFDALRKAGYRAKQSEALADGLVFTNDGRSFVTLPSQKSEARTERAKAEKNLKRLQGKAGASPELLRRAEQRLADAQAAYESTDPTVTPEQEQMAQDALRYLDQAMAKLPDGMRKKGRKQRRVVAILDTKSAPQSMRNVYGLARRGGDTMWLNPDYFYRRTSPGWNMATSFENAGEYTVNHELGHLMDSGGLAAVRQAAEDAKALGGMSTYGRSDPVEGYAEAFTAWQNGDRSPVVMMYAERFGWNGAAPAPSTSESGEVRASKPETYRADSLLPGDVVTVDGQQMTVDEVTVIGDTATITGTTPDGGTVTFEAPADEEIALGGSVAVTPEEAEPEPVPEGMRRWEDLTVGDRVRDEEGVWEVTQAKGEGWLRQVTGRIIRYADGSGEGSGQAQSLYEPDNGVVEFLGNPYTSTEAVNAADVKIGDALLTNYGPLRVGGIRPHHITEDGTVTEVVVEGAPIEGGDGEREPFILSVAHNPDAWGAQAPETATRVEMPAPEGDYEADMADARAALADLLERHPEGVDQAVREATTITPPDPEPPEDVQAMAAEIEALESDPAVAEWQAAYDQAKADADAATEAAAEIKPWHVRGDPEKQAELDRRYDAMWAAIDAQADLEPKAYGVGDRLDERSPLLTDDVIRLDRLRVKHEAAMDEHRESLRYHQPAPTLSYANPKAQALLADVESVGAAFRAAIDKEVERRIASGEGVAYPEQYTESSEPLPWGSPEREARDKARQRAARQAGTLRERTRASLSREAVAAMQPQATETTQTWESKNDGQATDEAEGGELHRERHLRDLTPEEKVVMTKSLLLYPESWVRAFDTDNPNVTTSMRTRGYNSGSSGHIAISDGAGDGATDFGDMQETMIHEFGHTMERAVPGLVEMEGMFWASRTGQEPRIERDARKEDGGYYPKSRSALGGGRLYTPLRYTMKRYGTAGYTPRAYEVFTTGVEEVLGDGDTRFTRDGDDTQLWDFTMGALLVLGNDGHTIRVPKPVEDEEA